MTTATTTPIPAQGDRLRINNIPADHWCKELYYTEGRPEGVIEPQYTPGRVGFMTGYTPFFDEKENRPYECSGCGNGIASDKVRFVERAPAIFWKFKDGIMKAHNADVYQLEVNHFECEFEDIKR